MRGWRWIGFGGTGLLAISAALAGAHASGDPGAGFRTGYFGAVPASFVAGLLCWVAGAALLVLAWIKLPVTTTRQGLQTGALWATPLLIAPALGSRDIYAYACQGWLWWHGTDPYAVGAATGGCPWIDAVPMLWRDTPAPYGPLAVLMSGLAAATGSQAGAVVVLRVVALLGGLLLAWQLPRLASVCGVSPALACHFGIITPLVLIHGVSAAHHDLLGTALVIAALAVAAAPPARGAMIAAGTAGLLAAAATAVKVTALIAFPFVLILLGRRWLPALAAAVAGFTGLSLATGLGVGWMAALRDTGSLAQWSSPPTAVGMAAGYLLRPFGIGMSLPIAAARLVGLAALAVIATLALRHGWRERHRAQPVVLACGVALAATALLGPVFYPWYAILPLAVLGSTGTTNRWLVVICTFLVLPNGLGIPVLTKAVGAFAVTAALVVWMVRRRRPALAA